MEKTFIVQGKGLEEALDTAAIVLHCEKHRVAYEILQEPQPGRYGQPGLLCKLRVISVAPSAEEMDARDAKDSLWEVNVPLSPEELTTLPPGLFLKELGEALARDLASPIFAAFDPVRQAATRRVIHGPVSPSAGPIIHVGDLHIQGSVHAGVRMKATGSIIVDGGVETAFLDAGDDIQIAEGLFGTARSASGAIRCRFAQGAQIQALQGDIVVAESAMHCQIHAGCGVSIGDILLGGSCYGEALVQVRIAGSETDVPTTLTTGRNRHLQAQIERLRERALRHTERLTEIDAIRHEFLPLEETGEQISSADRVRLWRAVIRKARLSADLRRLSQQKSALLGMINVERGSRICITGHAYPGVKIGIDDTGLEIQNLTQYATFSKDYEVGELRTTPYQ